MPYEKTAPGVSAEKIALYCGFLLLLGSVGVAVHRIVFLRRAVHVQAAIVGYVQGSHSSRRAPGFQAVFVYRAEDGSRFQAISPISATDYPPLRPLGTAITVVYDPAEPSRALPNSVAALWSGTITLGVFGAALLAARLAYLAVTRRTCH